MKHFYIFLFSCLLSATSFSQVGIGNTDPMATLDISAKTVPDNTDGILIPRLNDFPTPVPTLAQDGMMVFMTGAGAPSKGFYYWDATATTPAWVPVGGSGGSDSDWFVNGSTASPTSINDNAYTLGNIKIGLNNTTETSRFTVSSDLATTSSGISNVISGDDDSVISYGFYNQGSITDALRHSGIYNILSGTTDNTLYGIENRISGSGTGTKTAVVNTFGFSTPQGGKRGVWNRFEGGDSFAIGVRNEAPGAWSVTGTLTGVENDLGAGGNGVRYGVRNSINGLGSGTKYGSFNNIGSTAGGTHYGVYSDVRKANSFAGFFIGRMSIGSDGVLNRYIMPTADGTAGQVMTTDGAGNVNFSTIAAGGTLDEAYDFGGAGLGRIITADNGAVEIQGAGGLRVEDNIVAAESIVHDGDTNTFMQFTPDRIQFDAGGRNYIDIQHANQEIAFNEDSTETDFRIESGTEANMFFVDGSENTIGIGTNTPQNPIEIGIETAWDANVANNGQDAIFMIGNNNTGLNAIGASISFGGAHPARKNSRRAAIASLQTGADEDNVGLSFYVHPGPVNTNPMVEGMRLTHNRRLGINNPAPSATLDVIGTMQFEDGNEAAGFILTSDANGNATWTDPAVAGDGVGAERIDDLTDGRSDVDGSEDGSSIFLGIGAGDSDDQTDNRNVGIGFQALENNLSGENNTGIGYLALNANETGGQNTAVGQASLFTNVDGTGNTGLGYHALFANSDGSDNTAVGNATLGNNVSGAFNAALGTQALTFNTGASNTAMGYRASYSNNAGTRNSAFGLQSLNFNITGNDNVAVGYRSGYTATGSGNVYLGSEAGNGATGDNKLFIENTAADENNALIYGEFGADATTTGNVLRTNGELQIGNPTGTGYALPTDQGAANDVLTSNGDGTTAWSAPSGSVTASNGLTESSGNIVIGGSLTQNTLISQGNFNFQTNLDGTGDFNIQDGGTTQFQVDDSGNTNIGSTLSIRNGNSSALSKINLYTNTNDGVIDLINPSNSVSVKFDATGDSYVNTGEFGVGTSFPNEVLDVQGTDATGYIANFRNSSVPGVEADGISVRLRTSNPDGDNYYIAFFRNNTTLAGRIEGTGAGTGVNYQTTSDKRLKTNFSQENDALGKISSLNPTWYEYKSNRSVKEFGFLAQEVRKIVPQVVSGDPNGDSEKEPMTVAYGRLTPLLTAGMQELYEKVKKLEAENEVLKKQLSKYESLEARLSALENGTTKVENNNDVTISAEKK